MNTVALSLISHTNAGKTTLARTLLARDVGEVRDAPHVTEFAEDYPLIESPDGDALLLWDTPGFGDSVRLVKRLRGSANPIGWFLSEVWDRFRDRAFYASQLAMRNVRDRADVVLYLVNASETPESAAYITPEMELLAWMGKPVIVLLNQLGSAQDAAADAAEVTRWRTHLRAFAEVRDVMPMDAFARCWVQEFVLLGAVQDALPDDKRAAMTRLRHAWQNRRMATMDAAMDELAQSLARVAVMREGLPDATGVRGTLRQIGSAAKVLWKQAARAPSSLLPPEAEAAQRALALQTDVEVRASTGRLIAMHGLDGRAESELQQLIKQHFDMKLHLNEGKAAMVGGAVTGALGGLAADVGSAGLTLGGGMLAGAVLGAIAAAGAAHGVNVMRGRQQSWLTWSAPAMDAMVESALLRYLAVAHFGRGRGAWKQGDAPTHWRALVQEALASQRSAWTALWQLRGQTEDAAPVAMSPHDLQPLLRQATLAVLARLYPSALLPTTTTATTEPVPAPQLQQDAVGSQATASTSG